MAASALRLRVEIKDFPRKLKRFAKETAQRAQQIPSRTAESISSAMHYIHTGKSKRQKDILRYAEETHVVSDVHPDDLIFRFVMKFPGFKTREEAVKYWLCNR